MKDKEIFDYLESLERTDFKKNNKLLDLYNDFIAYQNSRSSSGFDKRCDIGERISRNDLKWGVTGNKGSCGTQRQAINFVDQALKLKSSQLQTADIDVQAISKTGKITRAKELIESEVNYIVDYLDMGRVSDENVKNMYYRNWGVAYVGWDAYAPGDENWITGMPYIENLNPRDVYVNPGVGNYNYNIQSDYIDIYKIFDEKLVKIKDLEVRYPGIENKIYESIKSKCTDDSCDVTLTSDDSVSVVRCQYRKTHGLEIRTIVDNEIAGSKHWLESDYQEYLQEIVDGIEDRDAFIESVKNESDEYERLDDIINAINVYLETSEDEDFKNIVNLVAMENSNENVLPELIVATEKRRVEYRVWYEITFLPFTEMLLNEPAIKKYCSYAFLPGDLDPKYSYPISMAYKAAPLLEMHSALLTLMMLMSIKSNVPQLVMYKGALVNEKDFLLHHNEPNFVAIKKPGWNTELGLPPGEEAIKYIKPPAISGTADLLMNELQYSINSYMRANKAVQGASEYSGESGKSIIAKQISAKEGDRSDIFKLESYFKKICDILKWYISYYKDGIPHKIMHLDDDDQYAMIDVNTDEENDLMSAENDCYFRVNLQDNVQAVVAQKKIDAYEMLHRGLINKVRALKEINPTHVDEMVKELKINDESLMLMQALEPLPEEQRNEIIQQIMQQAEQYEEMQSVNDEKS